VTITVPPERRVKPGLVPSLINPAWTAGQTDDRPGWYAEITVDGLTLQLSRLDGEGPWTIDAAFGKSGYPIFANGFGARYLLTKTLRAELAAQVDAAIAAIDDWIESNAASLNEELGDIQEFVERGDCSELNGQLRQVQEGIDNLPSSVDPALVSNLTEGLDRLRGQSVEDCNADTTTTETTETTETATTVETVPETTPTTTPETGWLSTFALSC